MARDTRRISWIKAALKDFEAFPEGPWMTVLSALTIIAAGGTPDVAKPLTGLGPGVWELAIRERGDAWRVVYALRIDTDIWVLHAFQKKSHRGIATPRPDIDRVRERIKRLRTLLS